MLVSRILSARLWVTLLLSGLMYGSCWAEQTQNHLVLSEQGLLISTDAMLGAGVLLLAVGVLLFLVFRSARATKVRRNAAPVVEPETRARAKPQAPDTSAEETHKYQLLMDEMLAKGLQLSPEDLALLPGGEDDTPPVAREETPTKPRPKTTVDTTANKTPDAVVDRAVVGLSQSVFDLDADSDEEALFELAAAVPEPKPAADNVLPFERQSAGKAPAKRAKPDNHFDKRPAPQEFGEIEYFTEDSTDMYMDLGQITPSKIQLDDNREERDNGKKR